MPNLLESDHFASYTILPHSSFQYLKDTCYNCIYGALTGHHRQPGARRYCFLGVDDKTPDAPVRFEDRVVDNDGNCDEHVPSIY